MTNEPRTTPIDYAALRERMNSGNGRDYWRSFEELADTPEFHEHLKAEFASQESKWIDPVTRRNFLKLMSASFALSGLTACGVRKPDELILPYVEQPEHMVLGKPLFFATAMPHQGYGYPVLVESHQGRPTKIEGNPDHPSSQGAAYAWMQASILSLYDPDRNQAVVHNGDLRDWNDMLSDLRARVGQSGEGGAGFRLLTETVTSPTLAWQIGELLKQYPQAKWVQYDPCGRDQVREGARLAFGEYVDTHYRFENADVVLSLDSDFMMEGPGGLRYSKELSRRRRVRSPQDSMARLYVVESTLSNTGSVADHRLPLKPSQVEAFARALAGALGVAGAGSAGNGFPANPKFFETVQRDLQGAKGRAVVVVGEDSSPTLHALAHAINGALGAVGQTVLYTEPVEARPTNQIAELTSLVEEMNAGTVKALLILGGNPVYNAPADLRFADALRKVDFRVHQSEFVNETSSLCHWQVPQAHYLESWSDIRTDDGTVCIIQPLIAPLYNSRTRHEMIGALAGQSGQSTYDLVQSYWKQRIQSDNFEKFWRRALHDGLVEGTAAPQRQVTAKTDASAFPQSAAPAGGIELILRPDPALQDGEFANNGWLQEMPRPFTKISWDNAVLVSPNMAVEMGLQTEDLVTLKTDVGTVNGPVCVMAGHADGCITVHLGHGRTKVGRVGIDASNKPYGFNGYLLRSSRTGRIGAQVTLTRTGEKYLLARTQLHFNLDSTDIQPPIENDLPNAPSVDLKNRGLMRMASLQEYRENPDFAAEQGPHVPHPDMSFYAGAWEYKGYAWGMVIDTSVCNGCHACVIACQAENNIPIVGREEVRRQHEMHWLRVDQYYQGDMDNPRVINEPLPCMHCETAPCEVVCPVNATVHSEEGLNDMVYNRCVGTRFCSNNCPYKVRRFNWFQYQDFSSPLKKMLNNPDVTVRSRGVMEKCTYCVQRIAHGRIEATNEGRKIRDGEVVTACAQTCPTDAIIFGDINDPNSRVHKLKQNSLNFGLLVDLNTKPRTTYLAAVRNENPDLEKEA